MKVINIEHKTYENPVKLFKQGKNRSLHYSLAEGDYAGFQLRIAALMSHDPTMIDAFVNLGGDLHSVMAVQVFHPLGDLSLEEFLKHKGENPYKKERKYSKFINFGFCCISGTLLKTSKGDIPIEEIASEEGYVPYSGDLKAIDDSGEQTITHTYKTKAFDTIEFELEDGSTLEVTPDHNCFVVREGKEIMVKASEILATDLFLKFK